MMLTSDQAAWAKHSLAVAAEELKLRAAAARKRGAGHIPIKPAADLLAEAYDRAAIELERARKSINQGA